MPPKAQRSLDIKCMLLLLVTFKPPLKTYHDCLFFLVPKYQIVGLNQTSNLVLQFYKRHLNEDT